MWQIILDGIFVLGEKWLIVFSAVVILCIGCSVNFLVFRSLVPKGVMQRNRSSVILIILFFALSLIARLAYLKDIFVPPYFDSVEHLRIIKELVDGFSSSAFLDTLPNLTPNYYHLGFHFLASLLTFGLRADSIDVILVLGQIVLASIPIPVFFLIRYETKNNIAAFLGMLLAGFGWYMPGFAVNWGKYPALMGILTFEMVLSLAYIISRRKTTQNRSILIIFLILGIFTSTLIHSRTLIIIFISFLSWIIVNRIDSLPKLHQYKILGIQLFGILILGTLIQKDPLLKLALDPYLNEGLLITIVVLILIPFAWLKFPRGVYFNLLFILFIFLCLFISVGGILPIFADQTLLDRPFVEIILYFPLSLLGGLGLAGLLESLKNIKGLSKRAYKYAMFLTAFFFIGIAGILPIKNYGFYPSDCCNFLKYDDTIAFEWLRKNVPSDARILVASSKLSVLPSSTSFDDAGADAGIWIPQLTGRKIIMMTYETDFLSTETVKYLCQKQIDYLYVGGTNQSFNSMQLHEKTEWYKENLFLQNTQLYQLVACLPSKK